MNSIAALNPSTFLCLVPGIGLANLLLESKISDQALKKIGNISLENFDTLDISQQYQKINQLSHSNKIVLSNDYDRRISIIKFAWAGGLIQSIMAIAVIALFPSPVSIAVGILSACQFFAAFYKYLHKPMIYHYDPVSKIGSYLL